VTIRQVRFRQSGGFANLVRGCDVDGEDLVAAHRLAAERLAAASGATPSRAGSPSARDQVMFELELDTGAGVCRFEFAEMSIPDGLGPLVEWLQQRSRPMAP
jgi:hypothetical protein